VTSEKGLNRIKIYDAHGKFAGVVAGADALVKDLELRAPRLQKLPDRFRL